MIVHTYACAQRFRWHTRETIKHTLKTEHHPRCFVKKKTTTIHLFLLSTVSIYELASYSFLVQRREQKLNRLHACLPLAGIGSLCGAPNSISLYCWYKLSISAMHLNVRPLFGDGGAPWKCELCKCNRRLIRDDTNESPVWMYCGSAA